MAKRRQKITPRALLELKMPGDVQVAPDGIRVAFGVSETDWDDNSVTQHLYVTRIGDDAEPRQVTRGVDSEGTPRWSPNGKWLAFLCSRDDPGGDFEDDEEPQQQVWLLPMDGGGGEAEKLSDAPEGVGAYDWLPDSSGIAYLAQEPRPKPVQAAYDDQQERKDDAVVERFEKFRQQIWRIDVAGKKPKMVHPGDFGLGEIAVSPDGKTIAFSTNYTGEVNDYHKSDLWTVAMDGGATRQLTDGPGGKYHPVWARDGERIFYISPLDPALSYSQPNLFAVTASGGAAVNLTEGFPHDLTGWHGVWTDAGGQIYVLAALGTTTAVFRWDGEVWQPALQTDEHLHEVHVALSGGIAYVASTGIDVPELCWRAPGKKRSETLTDLNGDWRSTYAPCPVEAVSWQSADGLSIEGVLTYPFGYEENKSYPLIVSLHGGPHGRTVQALSPYTEAQLFAAEGWAVLSPNYRGSEGYGKEFCVANQNDLGGGDAADVLAGIDQAIAEKLADPARLAVVGSSYGGYLVNWLLGHTDRFQAAISKFGIFSLVTDFSNSQAPRWETEYLGGTPWERPDLYAARSPAAYVQNIQTPVLIMHGDGDPNTFVANSQEMYQALHLLGRPVEYVHYPREGHGFAEPQHRLDEIRRCLAWFDKYLRGGGERTVYRSNEKIVKDGWELTLSSATLETYAGRPEETLRYIEVALVLRDLTDTRRIVTLRPADLTLTRTIPPGRPVRPVGLPVVVLGQKSLAEGTGWAFTFAPGKEERALSAPLAVTFRVSNAGGTYHFALKDFPPVTLDVPPEEKKPDEKNEES